MGEAQGGGGAEKDDDVGTKVAVLVAVAGTVRWGVGRVSELAIGYLGGKALSEERVLG